MATRLGDCLVNPEGEIVPLENGGHIGTVWTHPDWFGFTTEYLKSVYEKYGEQEWTEGKARDEILIEVFKKGWLRVNYKDRNDRFLINAWAYDAPTIGRLKQFARRAANGAFGQKFPYSDVIVTFYKDNSQKMANMEDLARGIIAFKNVNIKKLSLRKVNI